MSILLFSPSPPARAAGVLTLTFSQKSPLITYNSSKVLHLSSPFINCPSSLFSYTVCGGCSPPLTTLCSPCRYHLAAFLPTEQHHISMNSPLFSVWHPHGEWLTFSLAFLLTTHFFHEEPHTFTFTLFNYSCPCKFEIAPQQFPVPLSAQ